MERARRVHAYRRLPERVEVITKFELGFEYSVVSEDAFGQRALVKLSVIPVIRSLVRKPLFGGR